MGASTSKKNIVADSMVEDDSESYNLINIHAPTAGIGISIVCCLGLVVCLYRLYRYVMRAKCVRPVAGARGRRFPALPATTAVDMSSHTGHFMPEQGMAMFGGDARNSYWRPKEDTCLSCSLEQAWKWGGRRRSRGRFTQGDLGCGGQQRGVYGGTSRGESPPPMKRARARSVESF